MNVLVSWITSGALIFSQLFGLTSCSSTLNPAIPTDPTDRQTVINSSYNETVNSSMTSFGLELLKNVYNSEDDSVLISPLSVALALSMVANGADGETLQQFETLLGGNLSVKEMNETSKFLMEKYSKLGGTSKTSIANSLWIDPDGVINNDFIAKSKDVYNAEVFNQKLSDISIVKNLNNWVNEKTNKMIPTLITEPFDDTTKLLLVNALYLKNTWKQEFEANNTYNRQFVHSNGVLENVEFMHHQNKTFSYIEKDDVEGVILPYDDGKLGFVVLMPENLESFVENLDLNIWNSLIKVGKNQKFSTLGLPKFEGDWSNSLRQVLDQMGLYLAFDQMVADFGLLDDGAQRYYINDVVHAAKIKVNEKGTEASAVTMVIMTEKSAFMFEGKVLIFDQPFIYGIIDLETNFPLFLGTFE